MDETTDDKGIVELDRRRAMAGLGSPSERLKAVLADNAVPELPEGDNVPTGGAGLKAAPWRVPDQITDQMLADVRVEAQRLEAALQPVAADSLRRWLIALGNLVARQPTDETSAEMRLNALCMMFEDEPAGCFTKASLKRAAIRFKFFPSAAELSDFVAHEAGDIRKRAQRCLMILDTGTRRHAERGDPQGKDFRWSKEEAEAHGRRLYEAKAKERRELLDQLGIAPIPVPPRAGGESDKDYGVRLSQHAQTICRDTETELAHRRRPALRRTPETAE